MQNKNKTVSFTINADAYELICRHAKSKGSEPSDRIKALIQDCVIDAISRNFKCGTITEKFRGRMPGELRGPYPQFFEGKEIRKSIRLEHDEFEGFKRLARSETFMQPGRCLSWIVRSVSLLDAVCWLEQKQSTEATDSIASAVFFSDALAIAENAAQKLPESQAAFIELDEEIPDRYKIWIGDYSKYSVRDAEIVQGCMEPVSA